MPVDQELLELVGVEHGALLPVASTAAGSVAKAFTGKSLESSLAVLAIWSPVGDLPVSRHETFLAFDSEQPVQVLLGDSMAVEGLVGLDTRGTRVVLRVADSNSQTWVIDARDGTVDTYRLADPLAHLPNPPPPAPVLPAPPVDSWCALARAEPWLAEAVAATADSPDSVDRLAAAGLLVRLWASTDGAGLPPRPAVRAWLDALEPAILATAEDDAVRRAWALSGRILRVAQLDPVVAGREVAAIIHARDDLASVRRVLRMVRHGEHLSNALQSLDDLAKEQLSALSGVLPPLSEETETERWHAVAWQEPSAWWVGA